MLYLFLFTADSEVVSRGGWVLLEALIDSEDSNSLVTKSMELTTNNKNNKNDKSNKNYNNDSHIVSTDTSTDGDTNIDTDTDESSNFVLDCFFKRQIEKKVRTQTLKVPSGSDEYALITGDLNYLFS